jgi:hypothetical protein
MGKLRADPMVPMLSRLRSRLVSVQPMQKSAPTLICDSSVRRIDAKRSCQCDEVVLLFHKDTAETLGNRKFIQFIGLSDPTSVLTDRLLFVRQNELKHKAALNAPQGPVLESGSCRDNMLDLHA